MTEQPDPIALEMERAGTLIELGRFEEAATSLHRVLGQDPENGAAWCLLAEAQFGREDFEAAREAADRAVEVAPASDWAHRVRCIVLCETGDYAGAVVAGRETVNLAPHDWTGYACLSRALVHVGRVNEAVSAGQQAVTLAPNESDAHVALGSAFDADDRPEEAEAAYRSALALDPANYAAHNNLARVKVQKSRRYRVAHLADAAAGFQTAVQADPHDRVASYNLELTLRVFLTRLSFLMFVVAYLWWRILSSPVIVVLLFVPAVFGLRFVMRIGPNLRRHLRYRITHGRVGLAAAADLGAIVVLLYAVVGLPVNHEIAAGVVWTLSLAARLILGREVARMSGVKLLNERRLRILAIGFALIALVFGVSATADTGGQRELDVVVAAASFVGMIYALRQSRRV